MTPQQQPQGKWVVVWSRDMGNVVFGWLPNGAQRYVGEVCVVTLLEARASSRRGQSCAADGDIESYAFDGPGEEDVYGPLPSIELHGVTVIIEATPAATDAWRRSTTPQAPKPAPEPVLMKDENFVSLPPAARLTERQLNAIMAIGRTLGWTSEALRQRALDNYGVPPNELSRQDASAFIGELQQIATRNSDIPF